MKRFQFRLQRVLEIRRLQARLEEEAAEKLRAARAGLLGRLAGVQRESAESFTLPVEQQRDAAAYRRHLAVLVKRLQGDLSQLDAQIARQQAKLAEAKRRCELLERLRSRRLAEWNAAFALELDELAADAHRARLHAARSRVEKR
jgi:flagellar biosynthesis chaperone FliJ